MPVLLTQRLTLRELSLDDAAFIVELLNQPSFLRFIGDKKVRTRANARDYLRRGPMASYARLGFGLYRVELTASGTPIGICGLIQREELDDIDIGFAFLPAFWMQGYAFESATATLADGRTRLGLTRVVAVTQPDNLASKKTLAKLGFHFERMICLADDEPAIELHAATL